jgi:hypothetical protein
VLHPNGPAAPNDAARARSLRALTGHLRGTDLAICKAILPFLLLSMVNLQVQPGHRCAG